MNGVTPYKQLSAFIEDIRAHLLVYIAYLNNMLN